jgi:hypothetical protein
VTRLCILAVALVLIARVRVTVLPGWVVPLPVLILAAGLAICAVLAAWLLACLVRRPLPPPVFAGRRP